MGVRDLLRDRALALRDPGCAVLLLVAVLAAACAQPRSTAPKTATAPERVAARQRYCETRSCRGPIHVELERPDREPFVLQAPIGPPVVQEGIVTKKVVLEARKDLGIEPSKPDPAKI